MKKPKAVLDLYRMGEEDRIAMIGHRVMEHGERVAFLVDDWPEKADRYIRLLLDRFPDVLCEGPVKGPTAGVVTVIAYRRKQGVSHAP